MIKSRPMAARLVAVLLSVPAATALPLAGSMAAMSLVSATSAHADSSPPDYSADQVMKVSGQAIKSRVYHTAKAERREMTQAGMTMVTIIRKDSNVVWNLMPDQKMYMEVAIGKEKDTPVDLSRYSMQRTPMGPDTIDGRKVNKSKVVMKDAASSTTMEGLIWETPEGIPVRMETSGTSSGRAMKMVMEQSNIKTGPQPAALFDVPAGYSKIDASAMGMGAMPAAAGAMGGMPGGQDAAMKGLNPGMLKGLSPEVMKGMPPEAVKAMQEALKQQGVQ